MPWEGYAEHEHVDDSRTEDGALDCSLRGGGIVRYVPDGRRPRSVDRGSFRILGRTETLPLKHSGAMAQLLSPAAPSSTNRVRAEGTDGPRHGNQRPLLGTPPERIPSRGRVRWWYRKPHEIRKSRAAAMYVDILLVAMATSPTEGSSSRKGSSPIC